MELRDVTVEVDTEEVISKVLDDCDTDTILRDVDEDEVIEWVAENTNVYNLLIRFDTETIMEHVTYNHDSYQYDQILKHIPFEKIDEYLNENGYGKDVQNVNTQNMSFDHVVNFLNHIMKMPTDDDLKNFTEMLKQFNPKVKFRLMQLLLSIEVQYAD